jgi:hypothetical protein
VTVRERWWAGALALAATAFGLVLLSAVSPLDDGAAPRSADVSVRVVDVEPQGRSVVCIIWKDPRSPAGGVSCDWSEE